MKTHPLKSGSLTFFKLTVVYVAQVFKTCVVSSKTSFACFAVSHSLFGDSSSGGVQ